MAELADALDLGSSVPDVQVQLLSPAPKTGRALLSTPCFLFDWMEGVEGEAVVNQQSGGLCRGSPKRTK